MEAAVQAEIIRRLECINGHTKALSRMIAEQDSCLQIVHQISAVQGALNKVKLLLIEDYLRGGLPESNGSLTRTEHTEFIRRCEELFSAGTQITVRYLRSAKSPHDGGTGIEVGPQKKFGRFK